MSDQEVDANKLSEALNSQPKLEIGEIGDAGKNQGAGKIGFVIKQHYLHDLSVENPHGPVAKKDASELCYGLDGKVEAKQLQGLNTFLAEINLQLTAALREKMVFVVDVTYRVVVELRGIPELVTPFTLCVSVPEAVFPAILEILQRNAGYAGYHGMHVNAPDFRTLYVAKHGL